VDNHKDFEVEAARFRTLNVLTLQVATGRTRYYIVGCYIAPTDTETAEHVQVALRDCPHGCIPVLLGDLNVCLRTPVDPRADAIADMTDEAGFTDLSRHFTQRLRRRRNGKRWSWRQRRLGRWISSQPDYILAREGDKRHFGGVGFRSPRHHDSDHRVVVELVRRGSSARLTAYQQRRQRSPFQLQPGPQGEHETAFEALKATCGPPPPRKQKGNDWIGEATWKLVDQRAMLRRKGKLCQAGGRRLTRRIRAHLSLDRRARTASTAAAMEAELTKGNMQEAFRHLKGWYRAASETAARPCFKTMEQQTQEREELYGKVPPPRGSHPH
jgi:hypothetical protein